MIPRLRFYLSSLLLVWYSLSSSLFCSLCASPPSTPLALRRIRNGAPEWVHLTVTPTTTLSPCAIVGCDQLTSTGGFEPCLSSCESRGLVRRRSLLCVLMFLFPLPSSIPDKAVLGDSGDSVWARCSAPPVLTASSTDRVPSRSLLASASGNFSPVDLVLHSCICSCLAGSDGFRSEDTKPVMFVSNTRSYPFSSRLDRQCFPLCKSEKSASVLIPFLSPFVVCSKRSDFINPIGVCKLSRCSSRQDMHNLPTPIVLNLNTKFIVDIGALHGFKSVMVEAYPSCDICIRRVALRSDCSYHLCTSRRDRYNLFSPLVLNLVSKLFFGNFGMSFYGTDGVAASMGIVTVSTVFGYCHKDPSRDRSCYRLCTACILGIVAKFKHTDIISFGLITGELSVNLSRHRAASDNRH